MKRKGIVAEAVINYSAQKSLIDYSQATNSIESMILALTSNEVFRAPTASVVGVLGSDKGTKIETLENEVFNTIENNPDLIQVAERSLPVLVFMPYKRISKDEFEEYYSDLIMGSSKTVLHYKVKSGIKTKESIAEQIYSKGSVEGLNFLNLDELISSNELIFMNNEYENEDVDWDLDDLIVFAIDSTNKKDYQINGASNVFIKESKKIGNIEDPFEQNFNSSKRSEARGSSINMYLRPVDDKGYSSVQLAPVETEMERLNDIESIPMNLEEDLGNLSKGENPCHIYIRPTSDLSRVKIGGTSEKVFPGISKNEKEFEHNDSPILGIDVSMDTLLN